METPSFYAIIPASVRYSNQITANAKLLYGEITCLCNKEGYCWASNGYFAKLYNVSERTIVNWLNSLEKCGFISKKIIYKDGSNEVDKRIISIVDINLRQISPPGENNFTTPHENNFTTPGENNFTYNNIKTNNTSNNKKKLNKEKILDRILAKFQLYDFSEKVQERLLDFYSDRIDNKEVPREHQLIATLDMLADVSESIQMQAINNSIRGGWKTIYLPKSDATKPQSYVIGSDTLSYKEHQQNVENFSNNPNIHKF